MFCILLCTSVITGSVYYYPQVVQVLPSAGRNASSLHCGLTYKICRVLRAHLEKPGAVRKKRFFSKAIIKCHSTSSLFTKTKKQQLLNYTY